LNLCTDEDECRNAPCDDEQDCINTAGSYKCVQKGISQNLELTWQFDLCHTVKLVLISRLNSKKGLYLLGFFEGGFFGVPVKMKVF